LSKEHFCDPFVVSLLVVGRTAFAILRLRRVMVSSINDVMGPRRGSRATFRAMSLPVRFFAYFWFSHRSAAGEASA